MTTLVSQDGFYVMKLSDSRSKQFGLVADLDSLGGKNHTIKVPFPRRILKMFDKSEPLALSHRDTAQITELLYFLQASQDEIDEWIVRFPLRYYKTIPDAYLAMLWGNRTQTILPQSVLRQDCDNLQVYNQIRELLEDLLGVKVPNLLYVSYLVTKRIGSMSLVNYAWNLTWSSRMTKVIKLKRPDAMFTYDYERIPDHKIYEGKRELLELVCEDACHKLLPPSLFTHTPEGLGLERAKEMFEVYWKNRASLYRGYMSYRYNHDDPVDESHYHRESHAVTEVVLPHLLNFWTMLAEARQVVDITRDDMKMTPVTNYARQLADLLITKTTQCRGAAQFVYLQRVKAEKDYLAKSLVTQSSIVKMISLIEKQGREVLGEANAKFLLHYTREFSLDFVVCHDD